MTYEGNCRLGDLFTSRREKGRSGLPTLSVTLNDGLVNREDLDRKQDTSLAPEEHLLVKPGDIAYNMMRMWQGAFGLAESEGMVSPAYVVLKPKKDIDPLFASYLLKTKRMVYLLWAYSYGLTEDRLRLYFPDFAKIPANIPSEETQIRIGRLLATWDKAITATDKLLANSRKQRLALLGATLKLPPANNKNMEKTDNGGYPASVQPGIPNLPTAPDNWLRVTLGSHLQEVRRPVAVEPERLYTLVTVKRSRVGVQKREVLRGSEIKTPSQFFVKAGDFLISKRQIVHGACGIVPPELDGAIVSNEYAVLNSDGEIDLRFLRHLSETRYFQQTCFHSSIGVHVEKMIFKTERWLSWPFNIPAVHEQRRIVDVLDAASDEIEFLTRQLAALKAEKRALMQQLLTGKRRVRVPAAEAAP